jgi:hypothetical protein
MYSNCGPHWWVDGEYLYWWLKNAPIPVPLLTNGNTISLLVPPGFGALNQNGTTVLFGPTTLDEGRASGGRVTIGGWLDAYNFPGCTPIGVEASWFMLGRVAAHFADTSPAFGGSLLTRPFIDAQTNNESVAFVAVPGAAGGTFRVDTSTQLWGGEANVFVPFVGKKHVLLGGLVGFRYLDLQETLDINQVSRLTAGTTTTFEGFTVPTPATLSVLDSFETHNRFYGGQVGATASLRFGRTSLDLVGKVALGTMQETARVQGDSSLAGPLTPGFTASGGLLAVSSNSGDFGRSQFAVVSEAGAKFNYQLTDNLTVNVGYTYLYANEVVRPGQQIDRTINPALVPSSPSFGQPILSPAQLRPTFEFHGSDFWAHGLAVGLTLSF